MSLTMPTTPPVTAGRDSDDRRPLRVCFLIDRLSRAGTESQLLMLIRHLDRSRIEPFLCFLDGEDELTQSLRPADCPGISLGVRSFRSPSTFAKAWRFVRFLRRERIDVLQLYFPDSTYFGVVVGRLSRVPHIVRTRFNTGHWLTPGKRRLEHIASRWTDLSIVNCNACRNSLVNEGVDPSSIEVLPNGIEFDRFSAIPRLAMENAPTAERHVGMVANLRPVKDPLGFVQAAAIVAEMYPNVCFHLVGEGELRAELEQLIAGLGLCDRFVLHGHVSDVPAFLSTLHIAVLTSRSEGLSNAILEYMAAGRAIVATNVGAATELIDDGFDGFLVPPGDSTAQAHAILRLLQNPAEADAMAHAARKRVLTNFEARERAEKYVALYIALTTAGTNGRHP